MIRTWIRNKIYNSKFKWVLLKIQLFYLFFRFKYDYFVTNRYLKSCWNSLEDGILPLDNVRELTPPSSMYFTTNPTILLDEKKEIVYFARISNRALIPKVDFFGRGLRRDEASFTSSGTCSFKVDTQGMLYDYKIVIPPTRVPTFEDPKAFRIQDEVFLFGNTIFKEPFEMDRSFIIKVAIYNTKTQVFEYLKSPFEKNIEKNWIPFRIENSILTMVYQSKPLIILNYNLLSKELSYEFRKTEIDFNFHGGSQFVKIDASNYLRIVRNAFQFPKLGLVRLSYAMIHDENLNIKYISKPFIFRKFGFEICNGLEIFNNKLFFSWGEDEIKMFTGSIDIDKFLNWIFLEGKSEKCSFNIFQL